jgi:hypothetical protein
MFFHLFFEGYFLTFAPLLLEKMLVFGTLLCYTYFKFVICVAERIMRTHVRTKITSGENYGKRLSSNLTTNDS